MEIVSLYRAMDYVASICIYAIMVTHISYWK